MTAYELRNLKTKIQRTIIELNRLQKLHEKVTGREFVISGPLPEKEGREDFSGWSPIKEKI